MAESAERIRKAALKLFLEKGFRRTTIADIEAAAGLFPRAGGFYRHFPGKAELAAEIAAARIIETRRDLGLDGVLPLGDTRAELVLIAKGYAKAHARQSAMAGLIAEVQDLPQVVALQHRVDRELTDLLTAWLAGKFHVRGMNGKERMALLLNLLGGWVFFLSKQHSEAAPRGFTAQTMLDAWADFWTGVLDGPPPKRSRRRYP